MRQACGRSICRFSLLDYIFESMDMEIPNFKTISHFEELEMLGGISNHRLLSHRAYCMPLPKAGGPLHLLTSSADEKGVLLALDGHEATFELDGCMDTPPLTDEPTRLWLDGFDCAVISLPGTASSSSLSESILFGPVMHSILQKALEFKQRGGERDELRKIRLGMTLAGVPHTSAQPFSSSLPYQSDISIDLIKESMSYGPTSSSRPPYQVIEIEHEDDATMILESTIKSYIMATSSPKTKITPSLTSKPYSLVVTLLIEDEEGRVNRFTLLDLFSHFLTPSDKPSPVSSKKFHEQLDLINGFVDYVAVRQRHGHSDERQAKASEQIDKAKLVKYELTPLIHTLLCPLISGTRCHSNLLLHLPTSRQAIDPSTLVSSLSICSKIRQIKACLSSSSTRINPDPPLVMTRAQEVVDGIRAKIQGQEGSRRTSSPLKSQSAPTLIVKEDKPLPSPSPSSPPLPPPPPPPPPPSSAAKKACAQPSRPKPVSSAPSSSQPPPNLPTASHHSYSSLSPAPTSFLLGSTIPRGYASKAKTSIITPQVTSAVDLSSPGSKKSLKRGALAELEGRLNTLKERVRVKVEARTTRLDSSDEEEEEEEEDVVHTTLTLSPSSPQPSRSPIASKRTRDVGGHSKKADLSSYSGIYSHRLPSPPSSPSHPFPGRSLSPEPRLRLRSPSPEVEEALEMIPRTLAGAKALIQDLRRSEDVASDVDEEEEGGKRNLQSSPMPLRINDKDKSALASASLANQALLGLVSREKNQSDTLRDQIRSLEIDLKEIMHRFELQALELKSATEAKERAEKRLALASTSSEGQGQNMRPIEALVEKYEHKISSMGKDVALAHSSEIELAKRLAESKLDAAEARKQAQVAEALAASLKKEATSVEVHSRILEASSDYERSSALALHGLKKSLAVLEKRCVALDNELALERKRSRALELKCRQCESWMSRLRVLEDEKESWAARAEEAGMEAARSRSKVSHLELLVERLRDEKEILSVQNSNLIKWRNLRNGDEANAASLSEDEEENEVGKENQVGRDRVGTGRRALTWLQPSKDREKKPTAERDREILERLALGLS